MVVAALRRILRHHDFSEHNIFARLIMAPVAIVRARKLRGVLVLLITVGVLNRLVIVIFKGVGMIDVLRNGSQGSSRRRGRRRGVDDSHASAAVASLWLDGSIGIDRPSHGNCTRLNNRTGAQSDTGVDVAWSRQVIILRRNGCGIRCCRHRVGDRSRHGRHRISGIDIPGVGVCFGVIRRVAARLVHGVSTEVRGTLRTRRLSCLAVENNLRRGGGR